MDLSEKFKQYWKQQFPNLTTANCQLLIAVSGGVDSVVLTHLLAIAGFDFTIAHCNFQLRGLESDRDEQFVRSLGDKYDKKVFVKHFDTNEYTIAHKVSIQVGARELRYDWFKQIIGAWSLNRNENSNSPFNGSLFIATAHHADDNIETVLMKFFRGTGMQGLRGILPLQKDPPLIRPLLPFRKEELLHYAKEKSLPFVEDSSNASDKYTRNYFRNQLIPSLKELIPNVEDNILNNIHRFIQIEELYRQAIDLYKKKLVEYKGNEIHIPILKLMKSAPLQAIVWEIIKDYNFSAAQVDEVIKLTVAENAGYVVSLTHRVIKNRKWLIIATLQTTEAGCIVIEKGENKVTYENGELRLEVTSFLLSGQHPDPKLQWLDADKVQFPLLLRKAKQGDYFYPLGMQKKKKLNRFFIDQKLSATEKENVWVLETNKKILWVIGYRIDDRFKITGETGNILKISLTQNPQ